MSGIDFLPYVEQINHYEKFAYDVFSQSYKLICKHDVPTSLNFAPASDDPNILNFGIADVFGRISIRIQDIMNAVVGENMIKNVILDTVIHELFHVEQDIDYTKLGNDPVYTGRIEAMNITAASLFIIRMRSLLENSFRLRLEENLFSNRPNAGGYQCKSISEAYLQKLLWFTKSADLINKVIEFPDVNFIFKVDSNTFTTVEAAKDGKYKIDDLYVFNYSIASMYNARKNNFKIYIDELGFKGIIVLFY